MTTPGPAALLAVSEATWPPARTFRAGAFTIREGRGGGRRVSAATLAAAAFTDADLDRAEAAMARIGQQPLFQIRPGQRTLDDALAARGYRLADATAILVAPVAAWTEMPPEPLAAFTVWPRLRIMEEIWAAAGIGPERLAVMDRVNVPRTLILGRRSDRAAGVAFLALADGTAMLHALEVVPALRRQGTAVNILRAAGAWAQDRGAEWVSALVTVANSRAAALYASLNMETVGHYHYRAK